MQKNRERKSDRVVPGHHEKLNEKLTLNFKITNINIKSVMSTLGVQIGKKPTPGDHESNLKKAIIITYGLSSHINWKQKVKSIFELNNSFVYYLKFSINLLSL